MDDNVHEIAKAVAVELTDQSRSFGVTWTAHDDRETDRGYPWPTLRPTFENTPDQWAGPTLIMQGPSWAGAGRLRVGLALYDDLVPRGEDMRGFPDCPDIGLSASKSPKVIAADILRRLWPEACTVAGEIRQKVADRYFRDAERDAAASVLAGAVGGSITWDNKHHEPAPRLGADVTVYLRDSAARFTVSPGGGVRLERLGTLTVDQAVAIAKVIQ